MTDHHKIESLSDPGYFENLFRENFKPLAYYAARITGDVDTAREVVQSVFAALWEKRDQFDTSKPVKPYLYTAVHNRCLNVLRDRSKFSPDDISESEERIDPGEPTITEIEATETESRINDSINRLPEKTREVFMLSRFGGKKYSEIAAELGISAKTVENQVSRALRILRDELSDLLLLAVILFNIFRNHG